MQVTAALRLPPDLQFRRGEQHFVRTRSGKVEERTAHPFGLWSMSSEPWIDSPRLQVHLVWLLDQLEPKSEAIQKLIESGAKIDFFCFSVGSTKLPPSLPLAIRNRAQQLGISIVIDHYDSSADIAGQ